DNILAYTESNRSRYLEELTNFIAIPSISTNPENKQDVNRCSEWDSSHLGGIGMENMQIFPTAGHPIVYADWLHAPGKPTLLIYGHYDVQPVDPINEWRTPPFEPTIRGANLYGRG